MAHISDNLTHTKIGRRMPYILCAPLYAISFYLFSTPPINNPTNATIWFGGCYLLFYICDTITNVPLIALGPELSDDSDKRNEMYLWVKLAEGGGIVAVTAVAPILVRWWFDASDKFMFQLIAIIFGSWYIITMFILVKTVKERPASVAKQKSELIQPFVTSFYRSWRNRAFRPLLLAWLLDFAGIYLFQSMLPFFIQYYVEIKNGTDALSLANAVFFIPASLSIPLFYYFSLHSRKSDSILQRLKIGKRNAWILYNVMLAVTNFLYAFIYQGSTVYLYIVLALNGFPLGGNFLANSTVSDVVDYDEFLNFKRNDAQFTVFATFIPKIVGIPCQSLPLSLIYMLGFENPPQDSDGNAIFKAQSKRVKWFIRIVFVYVPIVLTATSVLVKMLFFPIKNLKTLKTIEAGITKHLQGKPAWDPITKQDVWIEKLEDDEQYLQYLLDQFGHNRILWLLSPDEIYRRHVQAGLPLRQNTLKHINTVRGHSESQRNDASNDVGSIGKVIFCCCCKKTLSEVDTVGEFNDEVKFGKNKDGDVVYVSIAKYEAHGLEQGVTKLKWVMMFYIILSIISVVIFVSLTIGTFPLITDANYAIFPAISCLGIGLSLFAVAFNILKFRAANEIKTFCEKKKFGSDTIAKIVYPKVKGQRGGIALNRENTLMVDKLIPEEQAHPNNLKSLTDIDLGDIYANEIDRDNNGNQSGDMYG